MLVATLVGPFLSGTISQIVAVAGAEEGARSVVEKGARSNSGLLSCRRAVEAELFPTTSEAEAVAEKQAMGPSQRNQPKRNLVDRVATPRKAKTGPGQN